MPRTSPARAQQSYRHEALLWHRRDDFLAGLVPFVEDGLDSGEPVMVALIPEHTAWLTEDLGTRAAEVTFVDMQQLGANPARIIPAWQHFLDREAPDDRPARGIGEPIWLGRRPEELVECQLHEALLNVAIDPELPFWLICPYDAAGLAPEVVEEAYRSHPVIVHADGYAGSSGYQGREHVDSGFAAELTELEGRPSRVTYTSDSVNRIRGYLRLELYVAGLALEQAFDLAVAFEQLAQTSLLRGATRGEVRVWSQPRSLVCELADDLVVSDPLVGRRAPSEPDRDGLWRMNQLGDLVQVRSTPTGTTVRVYLWTGP